MQMPLSLLIYLTLARREGGAHVTLPSQPRADGPVLWLLVSGKDRLPPLLDLIHRLREERDDLEFLLSGVKAPDFDAFGFPPDVQYVALSGDRPQDAEALLQYWRPEMMVWVGARLRPSLIEAAAEAGIAQILIDAVSARFPPDLNARIPGLAKPLLRRFKSILARDADAARHIVRQGAQKSNVRVTGALEQGGAPLPCDEEIRNEMAARLVARPLWLALAIDQAEEPIVESTHRSISRLSHRLLLVLEPKNKKRGPAIAKSLRKQGWLIALRSDGELPDSETQICIADRDGERGLWLRLSPVCFMGGTLDQGGHTLPLEAAALGSAILHGPKTGPFLETYLQLDNAGAARLVLDDVGLSRALQVMLAPDKAAAMANAAWEIAFSGAQATDHVTELIIETLDQIETV